MAQNEYIDMVSGEVIRQSSKPSSRNHQNITINDASAEVGKILVKEFGSDFEFKSRGMVDTRRFSSYSSLDVFWLMFFSNIPKIKGGDYARRMCSEFRNHRYSVNANHKKAVVAFQESLGGGSPKDKPKDTRSLLQKHVFQRGKPSYEE